MTGQPRSLAVRTELYHIAFSAEAELPGMDPQTAYRQQFSPLLIRKRIMGFFVKKITLHRMQIFLPLLFDMDQRPLPLAEHVMLDSGKLQILVFIIFHQIFLDTSTVPGIPSRQISTS